MCQQTAPRGPQAVGHRICPLCPSSPLGLFLVSFCCSQTTCHSGRALASTRSPPQASHTIWMPEQPWAPVLSGAPLSNHIPHVVTWPPKQLGLYPRSVQFPPLRSIPGLWLCSSLSTALSSDAMPFSLRAPGPIQSPLPPLVEKPKPQAEWLRDLLGPVQAENPGSPAQKLLRFQDTTAKHGTKLGALLSTGPYVTAQVTHQEADRSPSTWMGIHWRRKGHPGSVRCHPDGEPKALPVCAPACFLPLTPQKCSGSRLDS